MSKTDRKTSASTTIINFDEEHDSLVEKYRNLLSNGSDNPKDKAEIDLLQRKFHKLMWKRIELIIRLLAASSGENIEFAFDDRLLMDTGFLDARLLPESGHAIQEQLPEEVSSLAAVKCKFVSSWLADQYHRARLESVMDDTGSSNGTAGVATQMTNMRQRVLSRLAPFFVGLPGVAKETVDNLLSGEMDSKIISLSVALLEAGERKGYLVRNQLWKMRNQTLTKALARVDNPAAQKLFGLLDELYVRDWRERYGAYRHGEQSYASSWEKGSSRHNTVHAAMANAIIVLRSWVCLGSVIDGEDNPQSVILRDEPRLQAQAMRSVLANAQAFDRTLGEIPEIVILPYRGRGFYAWDEETIVIAVRPMVGAEDSLATALARQRMLSDLLQGDGKLCKEYERRFPGAVFQTDFPVDYRVWLCRMAQGDVTAMTPEKRSFFRDLIGPDMRGPLLPPNLRNISSLTRQTIRQRLEKQMASGSGDMNMHRRLGALFWLEGNIQAAQQHYMAALRHSPHDGETLLSLGLLSRSHGEDPAARGFFRVGAEQDGKSLWGQYCRDALEGLF